MLIDFYASPYRAQQPLSINIACALSLLRHTHTAGERGNSVFLLFKLQSKSTWSPQIIDVCP